MVSSWWRLFWGFVVIGVVVCLSGPGCSVVQRRAVVEILQSPALGRLLDGFGVGSDGGGDDEPRVPTRVPELRTQAKVE